MRRLLTLCLALVACGPGESAENPPEPRSGLTVLSASSAPTLEIGRLEGDPAYTFDNVVSLVTLPSAEIAVADAGAAEIRIYSPQGTFVRRVGRAGEGPGEFTDLVRVFRGGGDSLRAGAGYPPRVMFFDPAGEYVRQAAASEVSGDTIFAMDSWLHGRFWVEGALSPEERASVRAALDRLPPPAGSPGFRRVRVAEGGALWIAEPAAADAATRTWTITDESGAPTSTLDLPARFEPYEIRGASVTGRWMDENDVHYVRRYSVSPTEERRAEPAWLTAAPPAAGATAPTDEEFREAVRQSIRSMAGQQEMYYSRHYSYTDQIDSLTWERPEGMEAHFTHANTRGWMAMFTHPDFDRVCGLSYGAGSPAGWRGGYIECAPAATAR